jgi:hypothetical protein
MSTLKRTDQQIVEALILSGVPKRYHSREASLEKAGDAGASLKRLLTTGNHKDLLDGGVVEVAGSSVDHLTAFHSFVRSLVVRNYPVVELFAELISPNRISENVHDKLNEYSILALEGMTPYKCNPFGAAAQSVEWVLTRWLEQGKGLVLLTDGQFQQCDIWSPRFRQLVESRIIRA